MDERDQLHAHPAAAVRWPDAGGGDCAIERLLERVRAGLDRVAAIDVPRALAHGAVLVDMRDGLQRERDGVVPLALHVPRNVLEWRCAPDSPWRIPLASDPRRRLILMCDEGYQSSLAARTLQELGLPLATDVIGGFQAWYAAGLPTAAITAEFFDWQTPAPLAAARRNG